MARETPQKKPAQPVVWVTDDSPLEAERAARTLGEFYRVEVFRDGYSMLERLAAGPAPAAAVLDWLLPDISGVDVCRFLRANPATVGLPVLVLSSRREKQDIVDGLAAGADDYLAKPFDGPELVARVTALVRNRQLLERAERAEGALRTLLEHLPDAVVAFDAERRVTFVNAEGVRALGGARDALVGRAAAEVLPGLAVEALDAAAAAGPASLPDATIGGRVFAPLVRALPTGEVATTTVVLRDVTADRRAAAERAVLLARAQAARADAEAASRAKDEFLATVSHELRTPLTAVLGWTRMLRVGAVSEARLPHALETIDRNAQAQSQLIDDILDVSRIITGKLRLAVAPFDLVDVVERALEGVRPAADARGVQLSAALDRGAGAMVGDADRVQQVLWNLLTNAVKFTPRDGRVAVRLRRDGAYVEVAVEDSGQGIAPEFLPHVFERFRQADGSSTRVHGGLGLGLSIARHLVEQHGGAITAHSPGLGRGATFIVRIPVAQAPGAEPATPRRAAGAPAPPPAPAVLPRLDGVRVLVVDDEPDARELVAAALERCNATVAGATSAAEALAAVRNGPPDVLVSDIGMPGQDGYALIRAVRALPPDAGGRIPALALTAYAHPEDRAQAHAAGFTGYLSKPADPTELAGLVAALAAAAPKG